MSSDEFAVVGFTPPKGQRSGFGALLLARPGAAGSWDYAGRVGTGFKRTELRELARQLGAKAHERPTVNPASIDPLLRGARWLEPELVAEVQHRGIGNRGLLRQPTLKRLHSDKGAAALRTPRAAPGTATVFASRRPRVHAVRGLATQALVSHPDRLAYPQQGISKGQVAAYYAAVADWLLPGLRGRPLAVLRCPDGVGRDCFLQRHPVSGMHQAAGTSIVDASGQASRHLQVDDTAALMELVQFNALEFHPWGAEAASPDLADRLVFDLDPDPDLPWARLREAARLLRETLVELGLESYLRLSGGRGLHVLVALQPGCEWPLVRAFACGLAELLVARHPQRFVALAGAEQRVGRIYIDHQRNVRGATAVASYSLRARPGAPVAVPLAWSELGRIRQAAAFDLYSLPRRLARLGADPWEGLGQVRQELVPALHQLQALRQ